VEGLRPVKNGTDIGFKLLPGVFKDFCENALEKMNESVTVSIAGKMHEIKMPFIFIIDEINRGEMSKIFGELFYSIDPGYRVKNEDLESGKIPFAIQTQYSNLQEKPNKFDEKLKIENNEENKGKYGHFFVPENVYIIGTMNDIDRSVESMDFAMRRRFAFEEITAADRVEMLFDEDHGLGDNAEEAKNRMEKLNKDIAEIDGLSSAYHIGPAYFLKLKNYEGKFDLLWEYHIEGVVKEYLRGMDNAEKNLRDLAKAYGYSHLENYKEEGTR
jgi:5-methylcytosine-specific restriction endonuclease McrBC GTP-binding regulatory subunit McrB